MRECFRAKKLSNFSHCADWSHASNHVAKRYIEKVDPHVYFDDVRLQMDAKLWGEEYSRQPAVPKKVDISQMCVLEFINRSGKPLYHLEHFIEGTYRKYNSNSGFVDDLARNTPQAFSHFTFERSGHRLIVVDIQGVGNLWTDPQIHTFDGKSYGDGNLGIRGMALFFHTHRCNPLCVALELSSFDLPENEKFSPSFKQLPPVEADNRVKDNTQNNNHESLSKEVFSGTVAIPACRRSDYCFRRLISENLDSSYVRSKNDANNNNNGSANNDFVNPADFMESHSLPSSNLPFLPMNSPAVNCHGILRRDNISNTPVSANSINSGKRFAKNNGSRDVDLENRNSSDDLIFGPLSIHDMSYDSGISFDASSIGNAFKTQQSIGNGSCLEPFSSDLDQSNSQSNSLESSEKRSKEAELIEFFRSHQAGHRSSSVAALHGADRIILGLIHHELARLHASGRLASMHHPGYCQEIHSRLKANKPSTHLEDIDTSMLNELHPSQNVNWEAVLFHEEQSATLGCLDAIQCLAQYYLDLMIDGPLSECPIKPNLSDSRARGFALISTAASAGDRAAMIYLAEANFTGDL
ncbi:unnamed protein product [Heterobilharzia americana]|nr:unnamed protein product [Heterobilharzia americana]